MQLADWMAQQNVSDDELAARVRRTRATISRIRRKKQRPSLELAPILARETAGAVTIAELLDLPAAAEAAA